MLYRIMQINTYLWFAIDANDNRRVLGLSISIINMSIYKEDNSTRGSGVIFFCGTTIITTLNFHFVLQVINEQSSKLKKNTIFLHHSVH